MKKYILLFVLAMFFAYGFAYMKDMNPKLVGKNIVIDVGHGGKDSGTVYGNIKEKDINLNIALKLKDRLLVNGVNVFLTRDGDYDLSNPNAYRRKKSDFDNRIEFINNSKADMYLSIHINYLGDGRYYGAQVFYDKDNKLIAEKIQNEFKQELKSPMKIKKLSNDIYMYKKLNVPGVLIECGFLSNTYERNLLLSDKYQTKIVDAIVKGLINYF